jgi:nuclease-like protein
MRTTNTVPTIAYPLIWQTLAALITAGALLVIPTPVAADGKKEAQAFETPRVALSAKAHKPAARLDPLRTQLKGLPKHNLQAARQQAAFARRVLAARLPAPDRPQKPQLLQQGEIRLIDGDTFAVGNARFRIRGLNAPGTTEVGGFSASQRLDSLLHEGPVLVIPYGQDSHGRTLAEVYVNNRNVAEVMKEEGHDKQR